MANIKGKGQRLIPEELLKYLEDLKNKYPNAVNLVEANPTLEGGEDSLSSVLINGVKYAVGGGATLDDIEDSAGNKRFVEGDILKTENITSNINLVYGKWSLSGTHLMIVAAASCPDSGYVYTSDELFYLDGLPSWIFDKIIPLLTYNHVNYIDRKATTFFNQSAETVTRTAYYIKDTVNNKIVIKIGNDLQLTSSYNVRFTLDLLIDAE